MPQAPTHSPIGHLTLNQFLLVPFSRSLLTGYYEWRQQNGSQAMLYNCATFTTSFPVMMTQFLKTWRLLHLAPLAECTLYLTKTLTTLLRVIVIDNFSPHDSGKPCLSRPFTSKQSVSSHDYDP